MRSLLIRFREPVISEFSGSTDQVFPTELYLTDADGILRLLAHIDEEMAYMAHRRAQIFDKYGHLLTEGEAQE